MDILSIGIMLSDIIVKPVTCESLKQQSTRIEKIRITPGGDALNVIVNVASLGLDSGIISAVGNDSTGDMLINYVSSKGVDVSGVIKTDQFPTSVCVILVEPSGERHFLPNTEVLSVLDVSNISLGRINDTKVVSLNSAYKLPGLDSGGIVPIFRYAKENNVITAMDTASNYDKDWLKKIEETLYWTDIFLPSFEEVVEITGTKSLKEMRTFFSKYGLKIFGVKLGKEGCYITDFKSEKVTPAFNVAEVIDTVGAGDAFFAAFLSSYVKGLDLYDCALFANAAAAFSVQNPGATGGIPSFETILRFINKS